MATIARRADFDDLNQALQLQILKDEAARWQARADAVEFGAPPLTIAEQDERANVLGTIARRVAMQQGGL